mmetsp:Transcript_21543/g.48770  ORF Transcript_21543/g.48770 Transcript_21543/m.48770 type:complete len:278 (+) Transcript_21543:248-1081(+)
MIEKALEAMLGRVLAAAVENIVNIDRQPEWILPAQERIITSMQLSTSSIVSCESVEAIIFSKGFRNTLWKLKLDSSSFCRNFTDSCLRESMAYMATLWLSCRPTSEKCLASRLQMLDQSKRARMDMFPSATSTSFCRLNTLGAAESMAESLPRRLFMVELVVNSSMLTSHREATKCFTEGPDRCTEWANRRSTSTLSTTRTTISALVSSSWRFSSARLAPRNSFVKGSVTAMPPLCLFPSVSVSLKNMSSVSDPLASNCSLARRLTPSSICSQHSSK